MKILTKILNILFVIFVIIGIASSVYWVNEFRHRNDIDPKDVIIDSLDKEISVKMEYIIDIEYQLAVANVKTNEYREKWQKAKNVSVKKVTEEKVKNLGNIDEKATFLKNNLGVDSPDVVINGEEVTLTETAVDSVNMTIARYRDNLELLKACQIQVDVASDYIDALAKENALLVEKCNALEDVNKDLSEQKELYEEDQEQKEKKIRNLKLQRNIGGVAAVALIVLIAL